MRSVRFLTPRSSSLERLSRPKSSRVANSPRPLATDDNPITIQPSSKQSKPQPSEVHITNKESENLDVKQHEDQTLVSNKKQNQIRPLQEVTAVSAEQPLESGLHHQQPAIKSLHATKPKVLRNKLLLAPTSDSRPGSGQAKLAPHSKMQHLSILHHHATGSANSSRPSSSIGDTKSVSGHSTNHSASSSTNLIDQKAKGKHTTRMPQHGQHVKGIRHHASKGSKMNNRRSDESSQSGSLESFSSCL